MQPYSRDWLKPYEVKQANYIIHTRGLKLIGVRFYESEKSGLDMRKAIYIHKSLYGSKRWFYFSKGFNILEHDEGIAEIEVDASAFDPSFLLYSNVQGPIVNIGAIVGENGTGKSTIIDTVIRLINNLSAAVFGEDFVYSKAQHLHYIDNVYASLAVYVDTSIKVITCKGRKLSVATYETDPGELAGKHRKQEENTGERYRFVKEDIILGGKEKENEILRPKEGYKFVLADWFYTLVANYSLYAYNYRDFESERTNEDRLQTLIENNNEEFTDGIQEEDHYWLKGVFHKNDGYQTPVVIHPMRENGYINVKKVNYLGKQNLISLCFEKRQIDGKEIFPFRVINQTHHIVALYFYPGEETIPYKGFVENCLKHHLTLTPKNTDKLSRLEEPIKHF